MKRYVLPVLAAVLIAVVVAPVVAQDKPEASGAPAEAPALKVAEWVKGEPVKLDEGKGEKIYVVEFWATWCPPCRESIPHLTKLQKEYKDKDVVVVGVTDEDPETVKPFVEKMGAKMDYRVAIDQDHQTMKGFNKIAEIDGIPTAFVVDKSGKVVWNGHPMDEELGKVLKGLTEEKEGGEGEA